MSDVVAIVPAKDREDRIGDTVSALRGLPRVSRVVVVDDGSSDGTAAAAAAAGATVHRLPANLGKGGAVAHGVAAADDADVFLLIDADLGNTAALADALLTPVLAGDADMTIAVLPSAGTKGGFGSVKRLAATGIERATRFTPRAPLSGQRAVKADILRGADLADRFGLETALTIDAIRNGARVVEVDVPMDHRHTGRKLSGFRHRGAQGVDIARALWPRLTSRRLRTAIILAAFLAATLGALWSGSRVEPTSVALGDGTRVDKVVVFGFPRLGWDDVDTGRLPVLDGLIDRGAVSAMSVRTVSGRPTITEAYATLGAGTRVDADDQAGFAFNADADLENGTAAEALARRTGEAPDGEVVVVGGPATVVNNAGRHLTSVPGALGTALQSAGKRTAAIGNADTGYLPSARAALLRPVASAVMNRNGSVDVGDVSAELLEPDVTAPFGRRADPERHLAALEDALRRADVVAIDPGDIERAAEFASVAEPSIAAAARARALADTDALLGRVVESLPPRTLLLVVSPLPPGRDWHLTPTVAVGPGIAHGYLHSPSTRRVGVVTLTDLAPTILHAIDVDVPDGMIGHPLRARPGDVSFDRLQEIDRDAAFREGIYLPITLTYIILQALIYLLAIVAFGRLGGAGRTSAALRLIVLAISAYPLATFVFRAIPDVAELGSAAVAVLVAVDLGIALLATRFRRHPLSPLAWILGATIAVLALDVATGARLQTSSLLGYSLHTAARFTGFGNTAFATLAASTVLLGAIHVQYARRRREALIATACLFAFVIVVDGAPSLGSDVGGILTLVPVFGLTLLVLSGRRLSWRAVGIAGAVTLVALAAAAGIDLLRPPDSRTHLGRLVADIQADGFEVFSTTVQRKLAVNFRTYRSPWSWTVVIISAYMLFVLGWTRGWHELLPRRSALRAGVVGTLGAGLLGYAVNDSGVVVTALVFVYLGPFLTMLALQREHGEPVIIHPPGHDRPIARIGTR